MACFTGACCMLHFYINATRNNKAPERNATCNSYATHSY
jgi:hypothetical protein